MRIAKRNQAYAVIDLLKLGEPVMAEDLIHELGIRRNAAGRHLRELWTLELVYICAWDRQYQQWVPVYRWGSRPDVERPEAYSNAETRRRYADKRRAERAAHSA